MVIEIDERYSVLLLPKNGLNSGIQGTAKDAAGLKKQWERWDQELRPQTEGYLGGTAGVTPDGKFIVLGERGTLFLTRLSPKGVEEISRASAPGIRFPAWAAPVLSRGRVYLRDEDTLLCLDVSNAIEP